MHDLELLALGSGIVYAIGKALQPTKPKQRETIRYTKHPASKQVEIEEPTLPARLTTRRYPMRVPVDTTPRPTPQHVETPRNDTAQPSKRKARARRGSGPFGMPMEQFHTAQKYLRTGGEAVGYEEAAANNGWLVGLSESEGE